MGIKINNESLAAVFITAASGSLAGISILASKAHLYVPLEVAPKFFFISAATAIFSGLCGGIAWRLLKKSQTSLGEESSLRND